MIDRELISELEYYLDMDGSELDDLWSALIAVAGRDDYYLSEGFENAVEQEIKEQLQNLKTHAKVVTEEQTRTFKTVSLEWK